MTESTSPWTRFTSALRRARERRSIRWAIDLAVMAAILLGVGAWQTRHHPSGVEPPAAVLSRLEGGSLSLASLRGKPALVAFWAPWCTVCAAESQNLSWVRRIAGDRARVVSVAAAYEDVGQVRAYVRDHGVDYPVLLGDDALVRDLRVEAFPTVFVLGPDGRIRRSATGYTTTLGLLARLFL